MKNIIFWLNSKNIYWVLIICKLLFFWLSIEEFHTGIEKYYVCKNLTIWLSRQTYGTSCDLWQTRASEMIETRESCWRCARKISGVLSLMRYISDGIWRIVFQIGENREETRSQTSTSAWYTAVMNPRLIFDCFPRLFHRDILISWTTGPPRTVRTSESWQAPLITHFELFPHNILSPNPVNFILTYFSNLSLPFKPLCLPLPHFRQL